MVLPIPLRVDLHIHSIFSDGCYEPGQIVDMAIEKELDVIALADHDTIAGYYPAAEAAENKNLTVLPAVEISAFLDKREIHILDIFLLAFLTACWFFWKKSGKKG